MSRLRTRDIAPELRAVKENELAHSSPHPIVTVVVAETAPESTDVTFRNVAHSKGYTRRAGTAVFLKLREAGCRTGGAWKESSPQVPRHQEFGESHPTGDKIADATVVV